MPNSSTLCLDANLVIALVTAERFSPLALAWWTRVTLDEKEVCAPSLLRYEVTAALYRKALRGPLSWEDARLSLEQALQLDITYLQPSGLATRAFELAMQFNLPTPYDAHYLALAEYLACPLWTADERLFNSVRAVFPLIHWLGNFKGE